MTRNRQSFADAILADALAVGKTVAEAARAARVSERTVYRRMTDPVIRARITKVRGAALTAVSGKLSQGMMAASDRLIELVGHENPHVQIRAAKTVIQLALQVRKEVDLADRLDQLESQAGPPSVGPVLPTVLDSCPSPASEFGDPTDPPSSLPNPPEPGGDTNSPTEPQMPPVETAPVSERATATNSPAEPEPEEPAATPARPPSPSPTEPASRSPRCGDGVGPDRPGRAVRRWAVTIGLLVLAGLVFARPAPAAVGPEPRATADDARQTCQNLTEPAKWVTTGPSHRRGDRLVACPRLCVNMPPNRPKSRSEPGTPDLHARWVGAARGWSYPGINQPATDLPHSVPGGGMNLDDHPTPDQLRNLLRSCNDRAGHHVLWVTKAGDVRLSQLPRSQSPVGFVKEQPELQLRLETFQAGNGYVGHEAAEDDEWVGELFGLLTRAWAEAKGKPEAVYQDY